MASTKVIGIDLGTGNSGVAGFEGGKATMIVNEEGSRTTPSVVQFGDERRIGASAKRSAITKPLETVNFVKRLMGADFNHPDVQKLISQVAYKIVNSNGQPRIDINGRLYSPEEISSYILAKMKKIASDYYGEDVTKAIITVPAWFNDAQRQATKLAGEMAGLEVLRIINEPTAAILAANYNLNNGEEKTVAVFDYGCGTLDISVCELSKGDDGQFIIEVLASYGDVFLGGKDYDDAIVEWLRQEFISEFGADPKADLMAYTRLIEAAEKAKIELSTTTTSEINLPYLMPVNGVPQHLVRSLSRAKFDALTAQITARAMACAATAMEKANKSKSDIDEILLVGGSTRIPAVQDALTKTFGITLNKSANPDEVVALGAAIQANNLTSNNTDLLLLDVTPLTVGIETMGGVMTKMIESNTTIPTKKMEIFTTAVDNQPSVEIKVYQGERPMAADNKLLGTFHLDGILPARRGEPKIEVTFDVDANGILKVSAKDEATGKENSIRIEKQTGLTKEEIERIKAEAEQYRAADEARAEEVRKINEAESYGYAISRSLDDDAVKNVVTEDERKDVNAKVASLLEAAGKKNLADTEAARKNLEDAWNPISARVYAAQQTAQPTNEAADPTADNASTNAGANVEDVEFEEIK